MMDNLKYIIPAAVTFISVIAWFIRLEAKVLYLEKSHLDHMRLSSEREDKIWAKIDTLSGNVGLIMQSLARIEENLRHIKKED